jgi:hypothetical protein
MQDFWKSTFGGFQVKLEYLNEGCGVVWFSFEMEMEAGSRTRPRQSISIGRSSPRRRVCLAVVGRVECVKGKVGFILK